MQVGHSTNATDQGYALVHSLSHNVSMLCHTCACSSMLPSYSGTYPHRVRKQRHLSQMFAHAYITSICMGLKYIFTQILSNCVKYRSVVLISGTSGCENSAPSAFGSDNCVSKPQLVDLGFDITAMAIDGADNLWVNFEFIIICMYHILYVHASSRFSKL